MTLSININGQPYINFISASVRATLAAVTRGFSFTSSADRDFTFPIRIGDNISILADNIELLDGYIEKLAINYDDTGHEVNVSGRSRLLDLVDSTVPTQFEIDGTSLESICSSLFYYLNIDAEVSNEAGAIKDFTNEISSGEPGENAFQFLEKYSRKRQVILTSDGSNTLILARAGTQNAPSTLKNVRFADDNNILQASLEIDYAKRYYQYLVKSQLNTTVFNFDSDPEDLSNQEGLIFDQDIRESRALIVNAEESSDSFSSYDRAVWEKNIRIGAAFNYNCRVAGNSVNGALWLPNTLVRVIDNYCQIDATLLIKDVEYNFDDIGGSTTNLSMIKKESLTLDLEQSEREANSQNTGDEFIFI